uniref:Golgi apparatus protein 1 n=1 Tax=Polytomella parva TaxID=51329 RepID=A0A7S0YM23_9CHLO
MLILKPLFCVLVALLCFSNLNVSRAEPIIASAGDVKLQNLNGDIQLDGECAADIKSFCDSLQPGEGRIVQCLSKRMEDLDKGNEVGKEVSKACVQSLVLFKRERSRNINYDVPLARACKSDVEKHCAKVSDSEAPGVVLCLRSVKTKLEDKCKAEIFRTQREILLDFRSDFAIYDACKDDSTKVCASSQSDDGEFFCLQDNRQTVSDACHDQLVRFSRDSGDDIRLNPRLHDKCDSAVNTFCKNVAPGDYRVLTCLEENLDRQDFPTPCKVALDDLLSQRVSNFMLNVPLREACAQELLDTCGVSIEDMGSFEELRRSGIDCLQEYRDELRDAKCKAEVHKQMTRSARDFRFDEVLADSCREDRNRYCESVQAGSARVIRCLEDNRADLQSSCAAALFDHEVRMAEDIDFNYPMKKACAFEIGSLCKNVQQGHAKVIHCLETFLNDPEMSRECHDEVVRNQIQMAQDYRLNFRLKHACSADVDILCPNKCSEQPGVICGGLVLQCLQQNQANISKESCKEEVLYYQLMEVSDFRNDVILAEACRNDVDQYCYDVTPGEGRVHTCLRFYKDKISDECRDEEMKLMELEYNDIRLRPKLNKLCSEERSIYCKGVKPGNARVVKCLVDNMAKPNFGEDCRGELKKREEAVKNDYRLDLGVASKCAADVEDKCKAAKAKLRGTAAVLKCLVESFNELKEDCQTEISRAVRMALWNYSPAAPLTAICDADVESFCPGQGGVGVGGEKEGVEGDGSDSGSGSGSGSLSSSSSSTPSSASARQNNNGLFTIGAIGFCLSKALVESKTLHGGCRHLILTAAPKDARTMYQSSDPINALYQKVVELQKAAGLEDSTLVNLKAYARGENAITLTGWFALVCVLSLMAVVIGGGWVVFKRMTRPPAEARTEVHVKMGDL